MLGIEESEQPKECDGRPKGVTDCPKGKNEEKRNGDDTVEI